MTGIGGYDLADPADRVFAFDYDPSGRPDHLVLYRPGQGTIWILANQAGVFSPVYHEGAPGNGIGDYDLADPADRVFAFDYDHSGRLDHLVLYRPGQGTIWILANHGGTFIPVYQEGAPGDGIGGYDLADPADRVLAFDYNHNGRLDHLVLYRPGHGTIWILGHKDKTWTRRYQSAPGAGIGGYDLADPADRVLAFDYDGNGRLDHLVLFRPGHGTIWILANQNGNFTSVYQESGGNGIGGYDLADPGDDIVAFDYEHNGRLDHLVPYRPGHETIWILEHTGPTFSAAFPIGWSELYGSADRIWNLDIAGNADGRLEVFGISDDDRIWHTWQTAPGGPWNGGWSELYSDLDRLRNLSAVRNADGRLEVFGVSSDGQIWHTWQTAPGGAWNGAWAELYTPADRLMMLRAATNGAGGLEVFGIASDEAIWHTWQTTAGGAWNGGWAEFYSDADRLRSLDVGRNGDGRLEVFGISPDERIWHTWQTTGGGVWNGGWTELYSAADRLWRLDVTTNQDGRLEVFGLSSDEEIWHTSQTTPGGAWNGGWEQLYGPDDRLRSLESAANQNGRLDVIGISADQRIWHTLQLSPGNWSPSSPGAPAPVGTGAVSVYSDVRGYEYDETSEYWKGLCSALPCFAQLTWPGYKTTIVEDTIDGDPVVIQLWKAAVGPLGGNALWWPAPDLHATLEYQLINPNTGQVFYSAGAESTFWLAKWMTDASYNRYTADLGAGNTPAVDGYVLDYRINGKSYPRW